MNLLEKYTLEYDLALILLYAAGADGIISEEEFDNIFEFFLDFFENTEEDEILKFLEACREDMNNMEKEDLDNTLSQAIVNLGENFDGDQLTDLMSDIESIVSSDGIAISELYFLQELALKWNLNDMV